MAKILIAGCGDIGFRLAEILTRRGHQVVALRRKPPISGTGSTVYRKADITNSRELAQLDSDFDQIFFMPSPDNRNLLAYRAVYQTGLNNLLSRFATLSVRPQWFFVSSTSVYGQSKGEWVDEQSSAEPKTETGKIIRQAEKSVQTDDIRHVIVRFSGIYGPGRERLLKMAAQTPVIQFNPPYFSNRIHQDDCAAVLAFLSELGLAGRPLENCYLASDDDPAPLWSVHAWLTEQLKRPPPIQQEFPTAGHNQNKRCRNQRLKALGYRFMYPSYRDGYLPLVRGA